MKSPSIIEMRKVSYFEGKCKVKREIFLRNDQLHDVVEELFARHDHDQLNGQLKEASTGVTVVSGGSSKISFLHCMLPHLSRMLKEFTLK